MHHPFHGLITALITPFDNDKLDFVSLEKLVAYQRKASVKALVIAGSTGEGSTLTAEEYSALIQHTLKFANDINVIASCGSSSTATAVSTALQAEKLGVSALMCTIPPYNKPTQEGLYLHFKAIHDATYLPIMLYTIPGRTGTDFTDATILRLADLPRIVAIKDGGSDVERPLRISTKLPNFAILAGDDSMTSIFYAHGGLGVVSVISNIMPIDMIKLCELWEQNKPQEARILQRKLLSICKAMFIETNPMPIKYAASLLGLCKSDIRMPLCELKAESKSEISKTLDLIRC